MISLRMIIANNLILSLFLDISGILSKLLHQSTIDKVVALARPSSSQSAPETFNIHCILFIYNFTPSNTGSEETERCP